MDNSDNDSDTEDFPAFCEDCSFELTNAPCENCKNCLLKQHNQINVDGLDEESARKSVEKYFENIDIIFTKSFPTILHSPKSEKILDNSIGLGMKNHNSFLEIGNIITPFEWNEPVIPEKSDIYPILCNKLINFVKTDCHVIIDEELFNCHKIVLRCYSEYFDENAHDTVELPSSEVTGDAFAIIYEWMLEDENTDILKVSNILDIYRAAVFLGIKELQNQIWSILCNEELFQEYRAYIILIKAYEMNIHSVSEIMLPRIGKFFMTLVCSKNYLDLPVECVLKILDSEYIFVDSEVKVFMSAARWLNYDFNSRKKYAEDIMNCVRFGNMVLAEINSLKNISKNNELVNIISLPEISKLLDSAFSYSLFVEFYRTQQMCNVSCRLLEESGFVLPKQRNYIQHEGKQILSYADFQKGLLNNKAFLLGLQNLNSLRREKRKLAELKWKIQEFPNHVNFVMERAVKLSIITEICSDKSISSFKISEQDNLSAQEKTTSDFVTFSTFIESLRVKNGFGKSGMSMSASSSNITYKAFDIFDCDDDECESSFKIVHPKVRNATLKRLPDLNDVRACDDDVIEKSSQNFILDKLLSSLAVNSNTTEDKEFLNGRTSLINCKLCNRGHCNLTRSNTETKCEDEESMNTFWNAISL